MSIITFPSALVAIEIEWAQRRNDMESRSIFGAQAAEVSGPLWEVMLTGQPANDTDPITGAWQAFLLLLRGRTNQVALWNKVRPAPLGTMRGSMILADDATQGDTSLLISASGENAKTLLQGDLLGIGSGATQQVVMVTADATSDGSGDITVTIEPPVRNTISTGSPPAAVVTWDKPCALFRRQDSRSAWNYKDGIVTGFSLNLLEDSRP